MAAIDLNKITVFLRTQLPNLLAAYHFGSYAKGTANSHSDVDLAVLVDGKVDAVALWNLAQQLADEINRDVDLIDLRTASTVMQYQIIVTGRCLWARNAQAAILNIQRACEAALDMGQHLIRRDKLGIPQSARDVFTLLAQAGWISDHLATALKHMVGFRNIAVHDYQTLQLAITVAIIEQHLDEFLQYTKALIQYDKDTP